MTVQAAQELTYCEVHTNVETSLRCNKCGRLMCSKCAVRTPVGYRCKECVKGQQKVYFNAEWYDAPIQIGIALVLSAIGSVLIVRLPFAFLIAIFAGSAIGGLIGELSHRAVSRRRSRYAYLFVAAGIVLGGILTIPFSGLFLPKLIFLGLAIAGAIGRLRFGR